MRREEIENLLSPVVASLGLGLELLGIEYVPQRGDALLRLYIDAEGRLVTLDDCEAVSREVSATLDVADPIPGHYTLEVSSPGIERPLFRPAHFRRFLGEVVRVHTLLPLEGRRNFKGAIREVDDEAVTIEQDGVLVRVAHDNVQKARLAVELPTPAGKGKGKKGARGVEPDADA